MELIYGDPFNPGELENDFWNNFENSLADIDAGYKFGDNCVFINFNYTDTLQKRFSVAPAKEFHIHGEATDKKSIIFGHNRHPQEPEPIFATMGGRFLGLHFVEKVLYETDKHCQDNIQMLCYFLAMNGVMCEEIKDIYVLGQSIRVLEDDR